MFLSHYLKIWDAPDHPGYSLFFSTKQASLALVPDEVLTDLQNGKDAGEYTDELAQLGMLVPDLAAERLEVFDYMNEINRLNPGVNIAVILGLACNFSCVYCYEGNMKGNRKMSDETAEQLVEYAKKRMTSGKKKLTLDFYGGEPLLYMDLIKKISAPLKTWADTQNIKYGFSLVSNGSLMTREVVQKLLPLGLHAVKITLDGPPETHDHLRPYTSGEPSFADILANIRDCIDLVKIGIGGNFTRDTFGKFPELITHLLEAGITPEMTGALQFSPVNQSADKYANPDFSGGCRSSDEPWVAEATLFLKKETLLKKFKVPKIKPSPCMVEINDAFTVNHDGALYKCPAMIGHEHLAVGDLWTGTADYRSTYRVGRWQEEVKCRDCAYLPLCFGGCRDMTRQREGNFAGVECMREFFDATVEGSVEMGI